MSEVKVNKISPRTNCGTVTLGDSGDTFTVPSGATITNAGTATGFGRTGTVDWVTTPKVTGDSPITAVTGEGYFLNTTAGEITINLPAGAAGSIVSMADYAATWQTNKVTVSPNGTDKIGGENIAVALATEGQSVTLVYVDSTQGWINTMDSTSNVRGNPYIIATGGCITCSGDDKIHTFTGPGTFTVTTAAVCAADNVVSYAVVASGGGGAGNNGCGDASGAGGAGGFREYESPVTPYTSSPLDGNPGGTAITVSATDYPITVAGGGAAGTPSTPGPNRGVKGGTSTFSTVDSAGGGGGNSAQPTCATVQDGGSGGGGGGGSGKITAGVGDTPPTTPAQGFPGGTGHGGGTSSGGGGGGATVQGTNRCGSPGTGGPGGTGATTSITGSPTAYAGGGGGGVYNSPATSGGTGGTGGGGDGGGTPGNPGMTGESGGCNTGGGGGAGSTPGGTAPGGAGGSGVVIIRYKFQ